VPPRYAYWTILIDQAPTAFRARQREELLPTFNQLRRTNPDIVLKWFAGGKLWDNPEQARWAAAHPPRPQEPRGRDWRPGGQHADPRARFAKATSKHARPHPPGAAARARKTDGSATPLRNKARRSIPPLAQNRRGRPGPMRNPGGKRKK
jgi:hypothetical protein